MRVFKYRGGDGKIFERDAASLESNTFWAPNRKDLNDPGEGLLIDSIDEQIATLVEGPIVNSPDVLKARTD